MRVFVYGTLKQGFYNHQRVMVPFSTNWELLSSNAALRLSNEARFFVDTYHVPYLVFDEEEDVVRSMARNRKENAVEDTNASTTGTTSQRTVVGELLEVDQQVLEALDELEGVAKGRYTRSTVSVKFDEHDSNPGDEWTDCFVYHLRKSAVPPGVLGMMDHIENYELVNHKEQYVPPGSGRDMTRFQSWGGYL